MVDHIRPEWLIILLPQCAIACDRTNTQNIRSLTTMTDEK